MSTSKEHIKLCVINYLEKNLVKKGYHLNGSALKKLGDNSSGDISIMIKINLAKKNQMILIDIYSEVYSISFDEMQKLFYKWYGNLHSMRPIRERQSILYLSWDNIYFSLFKISRDPFYVKTEEDIQFFYERCLSDYNIFVEAWEKKWNSWDTIFSALVKDEQLGGMWRVPLIYHGLKSTAGLSAAHEWLAKQTPLTPYQNDQFQFLKEFASMSAEGGGFD